MYSLVTFLVLAGYLLVDDLVRRGRDVVVAGRRAGPGRRAPGCDPLLGDVADRGRSRSSCWWPGAGPRARDPLRGRPGAHRLVAGGVLFLPWVPTLLYQSAHTGTPWSGPVRPAAFLAITFTDLGGGSFVDAQFVAPPSWCSSCWGSSARRVNRRHIDLDLATVRELRPEVAVLVAHHRVRPGGHLPHLERLRVPLRRRVRPPAAPLRRRRHHPVRWGGSPSSGSTPSPWACCRWVVCSTSPTTGPRPRPSPRWSPSGPARRPRGDLSRPARPVDHPGPWATTSDRGRLPDRSTAQRIDWTDYDERAAGRPRRVRRRGARPRRPRQQRVHGLEHDLHHPRGHLRGPARGVRPARPVETLVNQDGSERLRERRPSPSSRRPMTGSATWTRRRDELLEDLRVGPAVVAGRPCAVAIAFVFAVELLGHWVPAPGPRRWTTACSPGTAPSTATSPPPATRPCPSRPCASSPCTRSSAGRSPAAFAGNESIALVMVANLCALAAARSSCAAWPASSSATTPAAERAVWLTALFPSAFVLVWAYGEALFLVLSIGSFLAARRGALRLGGRAGLPRRAHPTGRDPAGGPASPSRALRTWRGSTAAERAARLAAVAAPVLGLAPYLAWVGRTFGDAAAAVLGRRPTCGARASTPSPAWSRASATCSAWSASATGCTSRSPSASCSCCSWSSAACPASYGVYATLGVLVAVSANNLNSLERYGLSAFPLLLALAVLTARPRVEQLAPRRVRRRPRVDGRAGLARHLRPRRPTPTGLRR